MKKFFLKSAFTLAEVMITLTVIGIIAAVIIPVAIHSTPDESVLKFKKGHDTLYKVISTLVNSDQYYLDGDLGVKADGTAVNDSGYTYLCQTFADVVSIKSVNCSSASFGTVYYVNLPSNASSSSYSSAKENSDVRCNNSTIISGVGAEIITSDDIIYYQAYPRSTFASSLYSDTDSFGMYKNYKYFCMDIDGMGTGEPPFGYSIRKDGRIIAGNLAEVWLNKSIQGDE